MVDGAALVVGDACGDGGWRGVVLLAGDVVGRLDNPGHAGIADVAGASQGAEGCALAGEFSDGGSQFCPIDMWAADVFVGHGRLVSFVPPHDAAA